MLVRFPLLERFSDLVKLVDLVDRQLQLARFDGGPDVLSDLVENPAGFVDAAGAEWTPEQIVHP